MSSIPVVYAVQHERTSPRWARAFAAGCGARIRYDREEEPGCDVAMFGSPVVWDVLQSAVRAGRTWYYGDHGYFMRGTFFRCTRNAYMHDGAGETTGERFRRFGIRVRPWRRSGRHVLVCPPGQPFATLHGFSAGKWYRDTVAAVRRHTDRPIRRRTKSDASRMPLAGDLRDCWVLVTYMSNVAVEAVLHGVPVICLGECSALAMGSGDIRDVEQPRMPDDRDRWAGVLADNQFTMREMRVGQCWEQVR